MKEKSSKNKQSFQLKLAAKAHAAKYKKLNPGPAYAWPMGLWFTVFFIIPIIIILCYSFMKKDMHGGVQRVFTFDAYKAIFSRDEDTGKFIYLPILLRTLWITVLSTLISIVIAVPCGYAIARSKYQTVLLILVIIPFLTNSLIRIFAWQTIMGEEGLLNQMCKFFEYLWHLIIGHKDWVFVPHKFMYTKGAVIIVSIYMYLPYAILPIFTAVDRFDFSLLEAARDLGATKAQSMFKILLPGIKSGIISSLIFTFIPIFGNYTVPQLVGSTKSYMLGNIIMDQIQKARNLPLASAFSVVLTLITMVAILFMITSNKKEQNLKKSSGKEDSGVPDSKSTISTTTTAVAPAQPVKEAQIMEFLTTLIVHRLHKKGPKSENSRHAKRSWKKRAKKASTSKTVLYATLFFLYIPLFVIIFYSFNKSEGAHFGGVSFRWYEELFLYSGELWMSLLYSAIVALTSAVIATVLGSLAAIGISWYKFFGKNYIQSISFLPMVLPEVIMGVSLLIFLSGIHMNLGLGTIIIAHTTFCLPFVYLMVSSRVDEFDYSIIEASHDLGATERQTLFKVIIPAIMPGVLSGFMMSITLSIEDFVITSLVNGNIETLPIFVYNMIRHGVSPVINALSFVLILGIVLMIFAEAIVYPYINEPFGVMFLETYSYLVLIIALFNNLLVNKQREY